MPSYTYRCSEHGDYEQDFPIGMATRMDLCPLCDAPTELVIGAGVQIAPSALESRGEQVRQMNQTEDQWSTDMAAYRRMRAKGLQPPSMDGAARLESEAGDQTDIDWRHFYDKDTDKSRVLEAQEQAKEITKNGVPL